MFSLSRPLGRLPFLFGVTAVNLVLGLAILAALSIRPTGGGHIAVLVVVGTLQTAWFALHARRFADAGKGLHMPFLFFLFGLAVFVLGYLIFAALWSSPEVQREAFRTAGGISNTGLPLHLETNPLVMEAGRALASWLGAAGAVVLSGMILFGFGVTAFVAGCFTLYALILSPKAAFLSVGNSRRQAFQTR